MHLLFITLLSILPEGTVKDETYFFVLLSILIGLVAIAIYLRHRRLQDSSEDENINN